MLITYIKSWIVKVFKVFNVGSDIKMKKVFMLISAIIYEKLYSF